MGRFYLDYSDPSNYSESEEEEGHIHEEDIARGLANDEQPPRPVDMSHKVHRSLVGRWVPPSQVRREEEEEARNRYDENKQDHMDVDDDCYDRYQNSDDMSYQSDQDSSSKNNIDDDRRRHREWGRGEGIRGFFRRQGRRRNYNYNSEDEGSVYSYSSDQYERDERSHGYNDYDNDVYQTCGEDFENDDTFDDSEPEFRTSFPRRAMERMRNFSLSSLSTSSTTAIVPRASKDVGTISPSENENRQDANAPQNHYHIHFPHEVVEQILRQQQEKRGEQCCRSLGRFTIVIATVIALLSVIIIRYGPPAPPPTENEIGSSWSEFLSSHCKIVTDLMRTWFLQVPAYMVHWCWWGMRNDVAEKWGRVSNKNGNLSAQCSMRRADPADRSEFIHHFLSEVFGQNHAGDLLWQSLRKWDPESFALSPLILFVSGGPNVGKRHTAMTLGRFMYGQCAEPPLLELPGENEGDLFQKIMDYSNDRLTISPPASDAVPGIVVTITDIDEIEASAVATLVDRLRKAPLLATSIIIFTSFEGSSVSDRLILRNGGIKDVPIMELQSLVSYHVDQTYLRSEYDAGKIPSLFDAIIPLLPLERESLGMILKHQLLSFLGYELEISPGVIEAVLDHVVFTTWRHKSTQVDICTFSPSGATPAVEMGRTLALRIEACLEETATMAAAAPIEESNSRLKLTTLDGKDDGPSHRHGVLRDCKVSNGDEYDCVDVCRFTL